MEKELIAGVIVTYNRKELLSENIRQQEIQTRKLDKLIIIDNAGTDNTYEYLKNVFSTNTLERIVFIRLEENVGCAAAFALGMKKCFDLGYQWAYVMDDDGKPKDKYTIEKLIGILKLHRYTSDDLIIANSLVLESDKALSFKLFESFSIENAKSHSKNGIISNQAKLWNGTLISRAVYKKIGTPNGLFGFKGEEVDFKNRAIKVGTIIFTVVESLYQHPSIKEKSISFLWKTFYFSLEPDWKYYYIVRNRVFMLWRDKNYIRAYLFYFKFRYCMKKLSPERYPISKKVVYKAFFDGKNGRLGLIKDI